MLGNGRQSGSPQLDAKGEARKYCFHVALDLGCASIPAIASGERTGFTLPMHHYHGILVGLCLGDIAAHHFIEHLREELVAQIIAVESNSCKSFRSSFFVYRRYDPGSSPLQSHEITIWLSEICYVLKQINRLNSEA